MKRKTLEILFVASGFPIGVALVGCIVLIALAI